MIENKDWIKKQQMAEEIDENYKLLERVQKNAVEKLDENFELVVNRLFMAMGGFEKIEANMTLDSDMRPINFAPGGHSGNKSGGRDCMVYYSEFDLIIEITRRPLAHTAHWDHLEEKPVKKQSGIIVFLDITKIDTNLWIRNKMSIEEKNKFFHLCDVDFLFRLLKQQVTSFSKFNEFLKKSEKIWKEEENYDIIEKKIINLVRAENGL
tara:strand:+ start:1944 stop:2570 length:627 start_codon:yes stop_codon:yes gene_type:complete